jgi:hypothetical protein
MGRTDVIRRGLQRPRLAGAHGDATPLGRKRLRGRAPNALAGRRDERDTILQTEVHEARMIYRWGEYPAMALFSLCPLALAG